MNVIAEHFVDGRYQECRRLLEELLENKRPVDERLTASHNLLVCDITESVRGLDYGLAELRSLWRSVLTLPQNESRQVLTLSCASNLIYLLTGEQDGSDEAVRVALTTLDRILNGVVLPQTGSTVERLTILMRGFAELLPPSQTERALIVHLCTGVSICTGGQDWDQLLLEMTDKTSDEERNCFNQTCFLLSPLRPSLVTGCNSFCRTISQLVRIKTAVSLFTTSPTEASRVLCDVELPQLQPLSQFICNLAPHSTSLKLLPDDESEPHLHFAKCLVTASRLALSGKHPAALRFLRMAMAKELGRSRLSSIAMTMAACQFKEVQQPELQVEVLHIVEEILTNDVDAGRVLWTQDLVGFFLHHLGLFKVPDLSSVRFQLARALLQQKCYDDAAAVYKRIRCGTSSDPSLLLVDWVSSPKTSVVVHEHALALHLAGKFGEGLQVISSHRDDFVSYYLQSEMRAAMKQVQPAMQMINRALGVVNGETFRGEPVVQVIKSKLYCKLARLLASVSNTKDEMHQLRLALQMDPSSQSLVTYYHDVLSKLGRAERFEAAPGDESLDRAVAQYLRQNDDLALAHLLDT